MANPVATIGLADLLCQVGKMPWPRGFQVVPRGVLAHDTPGVNVERFTNFRPPDSYTKILAPSISGVIAAVHVLEVPQQVALH